MPVRASRSAPLPRGAVSRLSPSVAVDRASPAGSARPAPGRGAVGPSPSRPGWPPRRVARWPAHRPGPPQAAAPPAHAVAGVLEARPLPVTPGVCVATPGPAGSLRPTSARWGWWRRQPALADATASRWEGPGAVDEGAHTSDGGRMNRPCLDAARGTALPCAAVATVPGAVSDVEA